MDDANYEKPNPLFKNDPESWEHYLDPELLEPFESLNPDVSMEWDILPEVAKRNIYRLATERANAVSDGMDKDFND